jgi:hypothetical protein
MIEAGYSAATTHNPQKLTESKGFQELCDELGLTENPLFIHASCTNLIWELETYSYPEKKPDRNQDENPIKENDHAVDALRYQHQRT